ncbi:MAG: LVIVD repeat-containing protein [Candidatus Heimdallarchaeota archaeon]
MTWKGVTSIPKLNQTMDKELVYPYERNTCIKNENLLETIKGRDIAITGDTGYFSNGSSICVLKSLDDPEKIYELDEYYFEPFFFVENNTRIIQDLFIFDNYLFIVVMFHHPLYCWQQEFAIFNISAPNYLDFLYLSDYGLWITDIEKNDDYLYVVRSEEIEIFDLTDISNPVLLGNFFSGLDFSRINIVNNIAYLVEFRYYKHELDALRICNISYPSNPILLNYTLSLDIGTYDYHFITYNENYLYLVGSYITVISIANPLEPVIVNMIESPWEEARSFCFTNNQLFILDFVSNYPEEHYSKVHIIDTSDVLFPQVIDTKTINANCWGIGVYRNNIFVTSFEYGILVYLIEEIIVGLNFIPLIVIGLFYLTCRKRKKKLKA